MCIRDRGKLIITGDSTESRIPGEGTITYDIRFRVYVPGQGSRETVKLLMNVEAQKKFYLKYRIVTRGIFYGARMPVSYTHLTGGITASASFPPR